MNDIKQEKVLDTKIVNNAKYNLILREENGVKMKLWIADELLKENDAATCRHTVELKRPVLSLEQKISHLYQQLKNTTNEERHLIRKDIVKLRQHDLPASRRQEINTMIVKLMETYQTQRKLCRSMVKKLRHSILKEELVHQRHEQLSLLFCLQEEINLLSKSSPKIELENFVDTEVPPFNFTYINANEAGADVTFSKNPPMGCDCIGRRFCFFNNCCPEKFNSRPTYNEYGQVLVSPQSAIYECNKNCKCGKLCTNRVVQRGTNVKLTIFRTQHCGWGVRVSEPVKKGTFIVEYIGEIIKRNYATQKAKLPNARHYLFDLSFNTKDAETLYTIDSSNKGNISRFINHSCDPNLHAYSVWINSSDPNIYHVAFFASRDIRDGEEITFNYENFVHKSERPMLDDCKCGTESCKFSRPSSEEEYLIVFSR